MNRFATFVVVDWSGGKDTGPRPRNDALWACIVRGPIPDAPQYFRNRRVLEDWLSDLIETEAAASRRMLVGFDFPFGYPQGFARTVTGSDDPLVLWDWLAEALADGGDRFALAGLLNRLFPEIGPFWFNGTPRDIPDLPRKGRDRTFRGLPEKRAVERSTPGTFSCWQMGGAGAVGSQVMTGMASLSRLRSRHPAAISVWPFEDLNRPVVFAEVWPSILAEHIAEAMANAALIKDAVQVRVLARALSQAQHAGSLAAMLDTVPNTASRTEEGWILGAGHEDALCLAAQMP